MAGFEGTKWAPGQLWYSLPRREQEMRDVKDGTPAVSRSIHYGLGLAFEGIRFFVRARGDRLEATFVNLDHNVDRFRRGIAFNLADDQREWVPSNAEVRELLLGFLRHETQAAFVNDMAQLGAQGYLRPFTVDDELSIGVTFPTQPVIRVVAARYERYLGEPFSGVVVPSLIRASRANKTGCLKLGGNYLISVRAVHKARRTHPGAGAALFLDDRVDTRLEDREVTEWDSACALIALKNGTVIRIPDGPLILPSVTIRGISRLLGEAGIEVSERQMTYGELLERMRSDELVTVCSVGTAGILNRCAELVASDMEGKVLARATADMGHPLARALAAARARYWDLFRHDGEAPEGLMVERFDLGPVA